MREQVEVERKFKSMSSERDRKQLAEKIREYAAEIEYHAHEMFELATSLDGFRRIDANDFDELEKEAQKIPMSVEEAERLFPLLEKMRKGEDIEDEQTS